MTEPVDNLEETCNPQPLLEWIQEAPDDDELCRPCILPVTVSWYDQELRERGLLTLAEELQQVQEAEEVEPLARFMDDLKERVPADVRDALRAYDCITQQTEIPGEEAEALIGELEASSESSPSRDRS